MKIFVFDIVQFLTNNIPAMGEQMSETETNRAEQFRVSSYIDVRFVMGKNSTRTTYLRWLVSEIK